MASIIKTIANKLNVSTASVSRALNDRPGLSEELRARILDEAQKFNYAPSAAARGLATSQSFAIGFFVRKKPGLSAHTDPFYGQILHGAEQTLADSNYHLAIATLTDDVITNPTSFRFTRERRIDGMILAGPDIPNSFILMMMQTNIPVVLVDNQLEYSEAHIINGDDEKGAYQAAQHLLELGHHHIGILSGPDHWPSNRDRVRGYQRALNEAGLPITVVHSDRTTIESGQQALHQILEEAPQLTAICAVNDSVALGAIRAARTIGRQVPEDLSVIGFDDIELAGLNDPPLTTLRIPKQQMGAEAAARLIMLLKNPSLAPANLTLAVQFIKRASSAPPPSSTSLDKGEHIEKLS
jgi:LacI family transcriptional regulator